MSTSGISIFDAIHSQRAIRRFRPDLVPQEAIEQVLHAAVRAPSGGNRQPWSFIVIRDRRTKETIGEWYLDGWSKIYAADSSRKRNKGYYSAEYLAHHLAETPVLILACIRSNPRSAGNSLTTGASIYPAVQNLMLAALALGLGTVITTFHKVHEAEVKELLGIPENVETACLIPMGYPAEGERFGGSRRRPLENVTHYEHWGQGQ